jgi:hypothetical protein
VSRLRQALCQRALQLGVIQTVKSHFLSSVYVQKRQMYRAHRPYAVELREIAASCLCVHLHVVPHIAKMNATRAKSAAMKASPVRNSRIMLRLPVLLPHLP